MRIIPAVIEPTRADPIARLPCDRCDQDDEESHRQECRAGLHRRVAEDVLHVQRDEEEDAEHRERDEQHDEVAPVYVPLRKSSSGNIGSR